MRGKLKKDRLIDIGIISGIILCIMFFVYAIDGLYPFGNGLVSRADMTQQTIPAMVYYWDVLHFKASPFFCWNSGMGLNIAGAFNLGALFSPLNVLLYFTSRNNIYRFANILVVLKMIAIAISMYAYLCKYTKTRYGKIIGSLLYAFSGVSLVYFQIMLLMEAAFFLPILLIGVDRIIDKQKPLLFILVFTYSIIVSLYTAAISLLFIFLFYGTTFYLDNKNKDTRKKTTLILGVSVVESFLLSGIILIPAWTAIVKSPRGAALSGPLATYKHLLNSFWNLLEISIILRLIVCIALPLSLLLCFFYTNKKIIKYQIKRYKSLLVMNLLFLLSILVPAIEPMWYGGSKATWPARFIYISTFSIINFCVCIANDNYEDKKEKTSKASSIGYIIGAIILCVISTLVVQHLYLTPTMVDLNVFADSIIGLSMEVILVITYTLLILFKKKKLVCILLISELSIFSMMAFFPNKEIRDGWNPSTLNDTYAVENELNKLEIAPFERVKNTDYEVMCAHHPVLMGTEGVSNFWHIVDTDTLVKHIGLGYEMSYSRQLDDGGTYFSDALSQSRIYFGGTVLPQSLFEKESEVDILNGIGIYKSRYNLPMVNNINNPDITHPGSYFDFQNSLYAEITNSSTPLIKDISSEVKDGQITIEVEGEQTLYFYGDNERQDKIFLYINDEPVLIKFFEFPENYEYVHFTESIPDFSNGIPTLAGEYSGIVNLGTYKDETITLRLEGNITDDQVHLGMLDINNYIQSMSDTNTNGPKVESLSRGMQSLSMEVSNISGSYILLPIAYQEGWNCKVNGVDVTPSSYCGMCLIKADGATATITMNFVNPGTYLGLVMSLVGILILICGVIINRRKALLEMPFTMVLGNIADILFMCIFYVVLLIMFIIPTINGIIKAIT